MEPLNENLEVPETNIPEELRYATKYIGFRCDPELRDTPPIQRLHLSTLKIFDACVMEAAAIRGLTRMQALNLLEGADHEFREDVSRRFDQSLEQSLQNQTKSSRRLARWELRLLRQLPPLH